MLMTVKERILAIRLLEKKKTCPQYFSDMGVSAEMKGEKRNERRQ
jgi:hypothetical protein